MVAEAGSLSSAAPSAARSFKEIHAGLARGAGL